MVNIVSSESSGKDEGYKLPVWGMLLLLCIIVKKSITWTETRQLDLTSYKLLSVLHSLVLDVISKNSTWKCLSIRFYDMKMTFLKELDIVRDMTVPRDQIGSKNISVFPWGVGWTLTLDIGYVDLIAGWFCLGWVCFAFLIYSKVLKKTFKSCLQFQLPVFVQQVKFRNDRDCKSSRIREHNAFFLFTLLIFTILGLPQLFSTSP